MVAYRQLSRSKRTLLLGCLSIRSGFKDAVPSGLDQFKEDKLLKHWMFIIPIGLVSACAQHECDSVPPLSAVTYCTKVFGGQYQACSGPVKSLSESSECGDYGPYTVSLEMIISPERSMVVDSVEVHSVRLESKQGREFHASILMINEDQQEVCFDVADPPICIQAENPLADIPASVLTRPLL